SVLHNNLIMADEKISQLPAAVSVSGADIVPVVQSGTTKAATVSLFPSGGVFNVKSYGAVGNGSTDDTTAITNAISAIPSAGGVLYFPAGIYKVTSGFTISKPIMIIGEGGSGPQDNSTVAPSTINFSSATGTLFTVTTSGASFRDIELNNPAGTVTAG